MIKLGCNVAVIRGDRVLLEKRRDFEVWCLPGGMLDNNESFAQAGIREVEEETGLLIELQRFVGVYSRVGGGIDVHVTLYTGIESGGELSPQTNEVLDLQFFSKENLPDDIFWWHKQQILDALDGHGNGLSWRQSFEPSQPASSMKELYERRDQSGLSKLDFYRSHFEDNANRENILEVGTKS